MLKSSVGESEVIKSLQDEITLQKSLLLARDSRVKELMANETEMQRVRKEIQKDLEQTRKDRDKQKEEGKQKDQVIGEQKAQIDSQIKQIKEVQEKLKAA